MKFLYLFGLVGLLAACSASQQLVNLPPQQSVTVDIPAKESVEVNLKNKSLKDVQVKVTRPTSGEFVSGFGLGAKGKATVFVKKGNVLQLTNTSNSQSKVAYNYQQTTPTPTLTTTSTPAQKNREYVSFTLANNSLKSIPLIIPSVMNPNLSPVSKSGVDLKIGQKIFFKKGGRKYLLLEVDSSIKDGDIVKVDELLKARKKELNI